MQFTDRREAGRLLAKKLNAFANRNDVVVLALPRGGVPVAYEVAQALNAPLDVFMVRKLGVPGQEELAMGAIASGGIRVLNKYLVKSLGISDRLIDQITVREERELERRELAYRGPEKPVELVGRIVIIVDDGLATGSTMAAAVDAIKKMRPSQVIVAAPVAARDTCDFFKALVDSTCVCVMSPEPFDGVGRWYKHFSQMTDAEVCDLLRKAKQPPRKRVA